MSDVDPEGIKAKVQADVTASLAENAGIPFENVWVTFDEVDETNWFSGGAQVKELQADS